ncbi:Uncharacterised protein [Mycobacterium tuberculosis]|nr:Uncharacterised protein [Mycobacterium tuberculosis]
MLRAKLAETVLGLAAERHEWVLGIDHRLHHAGVATLGGDAVKRAIGGDRVSRDLLGHAIVPLAHDLGHLELLAGSLQLLVKPGVTVGVD